MSLHHRTTCALVVALSVALIPCRAFAQGQALDGIIEGFVRTQSESTPVSGATVRAFNAGTGYERSVVTDASGRYGLPLLPPGEYVVFVEASSFASMSQTGVALRAGQVLTVEFALPSSSFAETVQVTAEQSDVEVGRTVQSNTYDERTVRAIPTIGRSILDFFVLQPGVNAPPISSGGSGTGTPTHGLRCAGPAADERGRGLQQPAGRCPQSRDQPGGRAGVSDGDQLLCRIRPGRGRIAECVHAIGQQRRPWVRLSLHPAGLAELSSLSAGADRAGAGVSALQLRRHSWRTAGEGSGLLFRQL